MRRALQPDTPTYQKSIKDNINRYRKYITEIEELISIQN